MCQAMLSPRRCLRHLRRGDQCAQQVGVLRYQRDVRFAGNDVLRFQHVEQGARNVRVLRCLGVPHPLGAAEAGLHRAFVLVHGVKTGGEITDEELTDEADDAAEEY